MKKRSGSSVIISSSFSRGQVEIDFSICIQEREPLEGNMDAEGGALSSFAVGIGVRFIARNVFQSTSETFCGIKCFMSQTNK